MAIDSRSGGTDDVSANIRMQPTASDVPCTVG
jgi:hypothetical protein